MCIINFLKLFCPKIYCYFSSFLKSTKVAEYCLYQNFEISQAFHLNDKFIGIVCRADDLLLLSPTLDGLQEMVKTWGIRHQEQPEI